jgi:D-tyrosyl-tRNA(Tyr) deacylase
MRAVVQRVAEASVVVECETVGAIGSGLLVYLGVERGDTDSDAAYVVEKIRRLRIFPDESNVMNIDVEQVGGGVLVVSAFTTAGDARKGRRPSFDKAADPTDAEPMYNRVCEMLVETGLPVARGRFRAMMDVASVNDGPVLILLDSRRAF